MIRLNAESSTTMKTEESRILKYSKYWQKTTVKQELCSCKIIFHKQEENIFCIIKLKEFTSNKFSLMEFPKGVFQVEGRNLQKKSELWGIKWHINKIINISLNLLAIESIKQ